MREFDLFSETDPSLSFPRLKDSPYDDCESFLPLEPNVVNDALLTDLEEVFDPPSTSLPFVAPSFFSTPMDTSVSKLTLLTSPLPLAQCMGLEMGEISSSDASILEDVSLVWSNESVLVEPCLEEAPFEELCGAIMMGSITPNVGFIDSICTEPLDFTPTSSPLLPTTPSYVHVFHESLGDIRGYYPAFDPYCAYLKDVPRKIMWSPFLIMLLIFL